MSEPTHDEAVEALQKIRKVTEFADLADHRAFMAKGAAKEAREIARSANGLLRCTSRAMTRELPLFDERDGMTLPEPSPEIGAKEATTRKVRRGKEEIATPEGTTQPLPHDETPISVLVIPEEVAKGLEAFGFRLMGSIVKWHKTGMDWTHIPGIDEGGAMRLESAINRFLAGEPQEPGQEGRAA